MYKKYSQWLSVYKQFIIVVLTALWGIATCNTCIKIHGCDMTPRVNRARMVIQINRVIIQIFRIDSR